MNALAVCKKPAVSCGVMTLESEITFIVANLVIGVLNQHILEGKLLSCRQIYVRAVRSACEVLKPLVEAGIAVIR